MAVRPPNTPTSTPTPRNTSSSGSRDDTGRHGGHDLADDQAVKSPLEHERDQTADQAEHKALDHKRQTDEAIRRTDHLHDGDLFTPAERGQLDGVGHNKQGHRDEDHDQNDGDNAHNVPERNKVFRVIQVRGHIGDAVDILERGLRVLHERQIVERHDVAMTKDRGVNVVKEVGVILGLERLHGLLARDEFDRGDIRHRGDLGLDGPGLVLRERLIDVGNDLVLILQAVDVRVDVERQQRKAAHDEQARDDDRDRREGHETVREDVFHALRHQVVESIQLHIRSTRPIRH